MNTFFFLSTFYFTCILNWICPVSERLWYWKYCTTVASNCTIHHITSHVLKIKWNKKKKLCIRLLDLRIYDCALLEWIQIKC